MGFPTIAAGVGSIMSGFGSIAGAASGLGSARRQKELMRSQYKMEEEYQRKMTKENWDKYNSPLAQKIAMKAAGINPYFGDSSIGGMQMSSDASSPNLQDAPNPLGEFASNIQAGASSLFQMGETKRVNDSIVELNKANARKANADAQGQENENSIFDITKEIRTLSRDNSKLMKLANLIDLKYADAKSSGELRLLKQQVANAIVEGDVSAAQRDVLNRTVDKLDAEIRNLDASTDKAIAETQTENALRPLRKEQLKKAIDLSDSEVRKIGQEIGIRDVTKLSDFVDAYRNVVRRDASNIFEAVADLANQIGDNLSRDINGHRTPVTQGDVASAILKVISEASTTDSK